MRATARRICLLVACLMPFYLLAQVPLDYYTYPVGPNGLGDDLPADIIALPDGGFYFGIHDRDPDTAGGPMFSSTYVIRSDAFGLPQWTTRIYDSLELRSYDGGVTNDGGSIWTGHTLNDPNLWGTQAMMVRLDAAGNQMWTWKDTTVAYSRSAFTHGLALMDGGFIGSGLHHIGIIDRTYLVKLDSAGQEQWRWSSNETNERASLLGELTVIELPDSTLMTTGYEDRPGSGDSVLLFHVSANGNLIRERGIQRPTGAYWASRFFFRLPDGRLVMASREDIPTPGIFFDIYYFKLFELAPDGSLLGEYALDPLVEGEQGYITTGDDGAIYISGLPQRIYGDSLQRPSLIKLFSNFEVAWKRELPWLAANEADSNLSSAYLSVQGDRVYQSQHLFFHGAAVVVWDTSGSFMESGIKGRVYVDLNGNGAYDPGERAFPGSNISVNGTTTPTFSGGQYFFRDPRTDTLTVTLDPVPYHTFGIPTTGTQTVLPDPGTVANIIDFVVEPIPGIYDAAVELTVLPAQFSLDSRYTIHTRNVGVEPIVGAQLRLHTDTAIWLGDMTYAPDSTVGQVTYWSLPTIPPGGIHRIDVEFQIQFTWLDLADVVCDSAVVTIGAIDTLLTNNTDVQCWVPGASFDPNDKQVSWSGVAQSQIHDLAEYGQSPDSLDYLIRFQNMGTAPAVDVVVQDTLDADQLDLSSFRLLASSHDVTVQTVPPNIAVFIHEEIWLPDTSVGFAESQGWVKFRIGLEAPLEPGDRLENRAAIYFDFNPPIITNPATLTWSLPVDTVVNGWQNFALGEALILPNSVTASQSVRICLNAGRSGQAALSWVATNGNVVQQINREFHGGCTAVSSPNMPGSYRLIIELDGSRWVGKVVVTH